MKLSAITDRYRKRTIARDLIIWLTLAIISVIIVQGLLYYIYSSFAYQAKLEIRAEHATDEFANVIALPLWNLDKHMIQQISEAYLNSEYIAGIRVAGKNRKKMLFEYSSQGRGKLIHKSKKILKNDIEIGRVKLSFSRDGVIHMQKMMIQTILLISFSVITIIILGIHFIMKPLLNRPLEHFIKGIRNIAAGNYEHCLSPVPQTDINEIVSEVNIMAEHIASRTEQLKNEMEERTKAEALLAEVQALLAAAIEQSTAGIIIVDAPDMNIHIANPAALRLRGILRTSFNKIKLEEYARYWQTFFPDGTQCQLDSLPLSRAVLHGESSRNVELVVRHHSTGDDHWISTNATPIRNTEGDIIAGIVVFNDITEKKETEKALMQYRDELEERVIERTLALRKANDDLRNSKDLAEAATLAKSEFLANMSHEIRTPLNGVIAAADLAMIKEHSSDLDRYLRIIHLSGNNLLEIINDILDFSRIEAGKLELEIRPFNLDTVISNVAEIFGKKAAEKDIELLVDVDLNAPKALIGDPLRLGQVLTNLVANAMKFTDKGLIHIGVRHKRNILRKTELEFFVRDTGIGIAPDRLGTLFEAFTQADASTTREYGGTGLGLSICKQLVALSGGNIWAESELGKGSTFSFSVIFERQSDQRETAFVLPDDLRNAPVLLVDDCRENRLVMKAILESFGHHIETAKSGDDAISMLKQRQKTGNPFRLLLLDWLMPGLNGIETSKKIRQELELSIPIIMMTAFGREEERQDAEKARVNAFLTKPVSRSLLFNTILEMFGKDNFIRETPDSFQIATKASIARKQLRGGRILVVEDNLTNQEIMQAILKSAEISVRLANNGMEALEILDKETFDGILMDVQMPVMDGYEATEKIRNSKSEIRNMPIIAMTAHAMTGDREKCLDAGMNGYVAKPIRQEKLFHTLGKLIKPQTLVNTDVKKRVVRETASAKEELPDILPGIDIGEAVRRLCIDKKEFRTILTGFFTRNSDTMEKIQDAITENNWQQVSLLAHSLKGAAGNIGANELREAAHSLEKIISGDNRQNMAEHLKNKFGQVMESLGSLMQTVPVPAEASEPWCDLREIAPTIQNLIHALDTADPVKITGQMENLKKCLRSPDMDELEKQIEDYEYDAAGDTLNKIASMLND